MQNRIGSTIQLLDYFASRLIVICYGRFWVRYSFKTKILFSVCCLIAFAVSSPPVNGAEIENLTKTINAIGSKGLGHVKARQAVAELTKCDADEVVLILEGFDSSNKLAVNWLRAVVDTVLENALQRGEEIPLDSLMDFLDDTDNDANARRVAYEWITDGNPALRDRILKTALGDPSLEIRREAIENAVSRALSIKDEAAPEALKQLKLTLSSARDLDQIDQITEEIESLGGEVDLPTHFGFLVTWNLIGPFDNSGTKGFDIAYPPESVIDLQDAVEGKVGNIKWFEYSSEDRYGMLDLNTIMPEKYKGAIAYAHTTFESGKKQMVDLRLGCVNGNKIWVNGKLITSNHVYHANTSIDQYIARATLNEGTNEILVKIAQNEQEESWAQRWQFQLRICDEFGTAILPTDRR